MHGWPRQQQFESLTVSLPNRKKSEVISADKTQWKVKDLPICRKITLSVAALTNHDTLEGDKVEVVNYTGNFRLMLSTFTAYVGGERNP